jgi:hypothetical protein
VARSAVKASRTSGFALGLFLVTALIPLFVVAFAAAGFDEVADASPFGWPGTAIVLAVVAVVTLAGAVVAWRGSGGVVRSLTAIGAFVMVAVVVLMAGYFVVAGGLAMGFAILLLLAAVEIALIGNAVLQSPSGS